MDPCPWAHAEPERTYHDAEWGVPVRAERTLFEFLILEGAQAGLSWRTILLKRDAYRRAFDEFDPARIARYTPRRVATLLQNPGIVRNRLKIESTVSNARAWLDLHERGQHPGDLLWSFVGGVPRINRRRTPREVPASTPESDAMAKALKKLGFRFVGTTICYAFMQAVGMVNDHLLTCPRWRAVQ